MIWKDSFQPCASSATPSATIAAWSMAITYSLLPPQPAGIAAAGRLQEQAADHRVSGRKLLTLAPTDSTTPTFSWPSSSGYLSGPDAREMPAARSLRSVALQMKAILLRITASYGPGEGLGMSTISTRPGCLDRYGQ